MKNFTARFPFRRCSLALVLCAWNLLSSKATAQEINAMANPAPVDAKDVGTPGGDPNSLNPAVRDISDETPAQDPSSLNPAVRDITAQVMEGRGNPAVEEYAGKPSLFDELFSRGSPFHYALAVGETYDDNIFISPDKRADLVTHVAPSLAYEQGDKTAANANYLSAIFRPTLYFYAHNSQQNRVDYYADALYQHSWTRLTLSLEQRWDELSGTDIDVGNFFQRDIYTTTLTGNYTYDSQLSFTGIETQRISNYQEVAISSTHEWITDLYANYEVAPKLTLGIGPRFGFDTIATQPGQTYQDLLFRLAYKISAKINLSFDGGGEYRQFDGGTDRIYPVFDMSASYTPFDGTQLSLSANRQEVISFGDIGGDYLNTQVQVSLRQRFLENFYFLSSAGYQLDAYEQVAGQGVANNREDNYLFLNAGVEWDPQAWINVSTRYQYSQDDSTMAANKFNDNQFDIQTALQF
jgi:hypothetical protein